jgi:hypothetical protein
LAGGEEGCGVKKRQPKPPASFLPLPCVVLAIDPGATSGYAILTNASGAIGIVANGEREFASMEIVRRAMRSATVNELPLVAVAEKWTAGGWRSAASMMGLGAAWGAWEQVLREAGHPKRRIVRVYSQTWRAAMIGGRQRSAEQWKADAQRIVKARYGIDAGPDEAEAILIGAWAMHAGEVAAVLPKRRARKVEAK